MSDKLQVDGSLNVERLRQFVEDSGGSVTGIRSQGRGYAVYASKDAYAKSEVQKLIKSNIPSAVAAKGQAIAKNALFEALANTYDEDTAAHVFDKMADKLFSDDIPLTAALIDEAEDRANSVDDEDVLDEEISKEMQTPGNAGLPVIDTSKIVHRPPDSGPKPESPEPKQMDDSRARPSGNQSTIIQVSDNFSPSIHSKKKAGLEDKITQNRQQVEDIRATYKKLLSDLAAHNKKRKKRLTARNKEMKRLSAKSKGLGKTQRLSRSARRKVGVEWLNRADSGSNAPRDLDILIKKAGLPTGDDDKAQVIKEEAKEYILGQFEAYDKADLRRLTYKQCVMRIAWPALQTMRKLEEI
ncbi:hypothetical protein [Pelagibius sp.]|uniref:hypothetical protein n=1 Tax=Pelagibius sp. TaxID=1931238 RepID=UPI00260ED3D9|nr:hypothetical protein [Pelagibius sp.]